MLVSLWAWGRVGFNLALPEQLSISIGNVPLRLHISERSLHDRARERYAQFLDNAPEALPIFLNAADADRRCVTENGCQQNRFTYTWEKSSLRLEDRNAQFDGVRHEYGLDSLIRILLSVLLAPQRGFLLHAATVLREGRAYVFTGKSGAGKSTVASLSPAGSVLTDEISLLKFVDGAWHAFGTPFWGEFRAEGANVHAPIAGLYFLKQAPDDRVETISAREALHAMLPNILFFSHDQHMTEDLLGVLAEFVYSVPCRRLLFRKDSHFWSVVTA
ncbi:MAG: hypothetical protein WBD87_09925 [Candidatus Acidiferrales bacterium]